MKIIYPLAIVFIIFIALFAPVKDTDPPYARKMGFLSFGTIAFVLLCFAPEIYSKRIEFDDEEIVIYCVWRKPRHIRWADVVSVKSDQIQCILETRNQGKIVLLTYLEGLRSLQEAAQKRVAGA